MTLTRILSRIAEEQNLHALEVESTLMTFISEKCLKNEVMQKALKITNDEMEDIYREAYQAYHADQFEAASALFRWLSLFNPFVLKYWMGFAASSQLLKKYEEALKAYSVAAVLDPENPYPHFHAFECYQSLENEMEASKALEDAYRVASKESKYRDLLPIIISLQGGTR
jgi:type III secretion system low calcium response chaperone LcrH/SycD